MGERGSFTKGGTVESDRGLSGFQGRGRLESLGEKSAIRSHLLQKRLSLSSEEVHRLSEKIAANLSTLKLFKDAKTIALYSPVRNEVRTEGIFKNVRGRGKEVYFPRVEGDLLRFLKIDDLSELEPGRFGILEPPRCLGEVRIGVIDLVVVPGVAFDRSGRRLGYGKGYYDRAMLRVGREKRVGLAYCFQVLDRIPAEVWDEGVGMVVTESGVIRCEGGK